LEDDRSRFRQPEPPRIPVGGPIREQRAPKKRAVVDDQGGDASADDESVQTRRGPWFRTGLDPRDPPAYDQTHEAKRDSHKDAVEDSPAATGSQKESDHCRDGDEPDDERETAVPQHVARSPSQSDAVEQTRTRDEEQDVDSEKSRH
jgi:hypothetical protein